MAFVEKRFPEKFFDGSEVSLGFQTDITANPTTGREVRNQRRSVELRTWDIQKILVQRDWEELQSFFLAIARGAYHGFRLRDLSDYKAKDTQNPDLPALKVIDAEAGTYQLERYYQYDGERYTRTIYKPVAGTLAIYVDGVMVFENNAAYGWSCDHATGIVTFTTPENLTGKNPVADFEFDKPVRFMEDLFSVRYIGPNAFRTRVGLREIRL